MCLRPTQFCLRQTKPTIFLTPFLRVFFCFAVATRWRNWLHFAWQGRGRLDKKIFFITFIRWSKLLRPVEPEQAFEVFRFTHKYAELVGVSETAGEINFTFQDRLENSRWWSCSSLLWRHRETEEDVWLFLPTIQPWSCWQADLSLPPLVSAHYSYC